MKIIKRFLTTNDNILKSIPKQFKRIKYQEELKKLSDEFIEKNFEWFKEMLEKCKVPIDNKIFTRVNEYRLQTADGFSYTLFIDGFAVGDSCLKLTKGKSLEWKILTREFTSHDLKYIFVRKGGIREFYFNHSVGDYQVCIFKDRLNNFLYNTNTNPPDDKGYFREFKDGDDEKYRPSDESIINALKMAGVKV